MLLAEQAFWQKVQQFRLMGNDMTEVGFDGGAIVPYHHVLTAICILEMLS